MAGVLVLVPPAGAVVDVVSPVVESYVVRVARASPEGSTVEMFGWRSVQSYPVVVVRASASVRMPGTRKRPSGPRWLRSGREPDCRSHKPGVFGGRFKTRSIKAKALTSKCWSGLSFCSGARI
ncbi:hypothetical protein GCM10009682_10390 [Luedemannella flava]|uniref:Secreted protein n=1 Tax=Luedemannella flava TaxID=349316 RepID=A0ABN2LIV0_9ACTN